MRVNLVVLRKLCEKSRWFPGKFTRLAQILHDRRSWRSRQISTLKEISRNLLAILYNSGLSRGGDVQVPIVSDAGPSVIPRMSRWHTCPTLHQSPSKGSAYLDSQLRVPKRLKSKQNLRRGSLSLLTKRLRLSQPSRDRSRCEQLVKKPVDVDSEEVAASFFILFVYLPVPPCKSINTTIPVQHKLTFSAVLISDGIFTLTPESGPDQDCLSRFPKAS